MDTPAETVTTAPRRYRTTLERMNRPVVQISPVPMRQACTADLITAAGRARAFVMRVGRPSVGAIKAMYAMLPSTARAYPELASRWGVYAVIAVEDWEYSREPECPKANATITVH